MSNMSQKLILIIVAVSSLILIWLGTIPPTEIPEVNPEVVPEPQDYTIYLGYIATTARARAKKAKCDDKINSETLKC
jgi:hypothetical protein